MFGSCMKSMLRSALCTFCCYFLFFGSKINAMPNLTDLLLAGKMLVTPYESQPQQNVGYTKSNNHNLTAKDLFVKQMANLSRSLIVDYSKANKLPMINDEVINELTLFGQTVTTIANISWICDNESVILCHRKIDVRFVHYSLKEYYSRIKDKSKMWNDYDDYTILATLLFLTFKYNYQDIYDFSSVKNGSSVNISFNQLFFKVFHKIYPNFIGVVEKFNKLEKEIIVDLVKKESSNNDEGFGYHLYIDYDEYLRSIVVEDIWRCQPYSSDTIRDFDIYKRIKYSDFYQRYKLELYFNAARLYKDRIAKSFFDIEKIDILVSDLLNQFEDKNEQLSAFKGITNKEEINKKYSSSVIRGDFMKAVEKIIKNFSNNVEEELCLFENIFYAIYGENVDLNEAM